MVGFLFYKVGQTIALLLPLKFGYWVAVRFADLCYPLSRKSRRLLKDNLRIALRADEARIDRYARCTFRNFGKYLVDFFRFSRVDANFIRKYVKVEGRENLDRALAQNKGAIIVSAHLGDWELGIVVTSLLGYSTSAIALAHENRRINDFFVRQRSRKGVKVIPVGKAAGASLEALANNQVVALLGDRNYSRHGLDIEFFGRPTQVPKGHAIFSLKSGSPIVPAFIVREADDTLRFVYEPPIEFKPTGDLRNDLEQIVRRCLGVIEGYVRRYPSQWYVFAPIWHR